MWVIWLIFFSSVKHLFEIDLPHFKILVFFSCFMVKNLTDFRNLFESQNFESLSIFLS